MFRHSVHKSESLEVNPHTYVNTLKLILILSSHLLLDHPSGHFPSGFSAQSVCISHTSMCVLHPRPSNFLRLLIPI
jgi:hypothetical protein